MPPALPPTTAIPQSSFPFNFFPQHRRSLHCSQHTTPSIHCLLPSQRPMEPQDFQDFLPLMAQNLGQDGFMEELCKGFHLLADPAAGAITVASLKRNARFLGLQGMSDDELREMITVGDMDRDGELNLHEFCVLMVRSSPCMMKEAEELLEEALIAEMVEFVNFEL